MRNAARALAITSIGALAACGAPPRPSPTPPPAPRDAGPPEAGAPLANDAGPAPPAVASFDALAAQAPTAAPLMREVLRAEWPAEARLEVERDSCVRAAFAADAEVTVSFVDETGARRGPPTRGREGVVPAAGPVCFRKGEALTLAVEPIPAVGRAVVWAAP